MLMGGKTQGGWGGSTVKKKRNPFLRPVTNNSLVGHRREFRDTFRTPCGSLELFLELLELLLGLLATRSRLLRELFCLGLLHLVQLHHLFLTRWHIITSLRLWLIICSVFPS